MLNEFHSCELVSAESIRLDSEYKSKQYRSAIDATINQKDWHIFNLQKLVENLTAENSELGEKLEKQALEIEELKQQCASESAVKKSCANCLKFLTVNNLFNVVCADTSKPYKDCINKDFALYSPREKNNR